MNTTKIATLSTALLLGAFLTGCPKDKDQQANNDPVTASEASQALTESTADSQAATLTQNTIEISTNFTIGKAVADAAGELKTFIATELPCAELDLAGSTLTVTYGAKPGNCTYHGQTFTGEHAITLTKTDAGDVEVDHKWTAISNGLVRVNGTAHVTWSLANASRHVTYDLDWTRVADNLTGDATGDVTQAALPEGVTTGIEINGSRSWTGAAGKWDLTVSGVQVRWQDPVPQAGSYRLATPNNKSLSLTFARVNDTTIDVTLASGTRSFSFDVAETGTATQK